ncbi:MAG: DUF2147 domain-containing protein [Hyphomicrobiaceae bacterium]|nr:DUF2147 domain-containing protein [Hyphomicrobiaceae bacterium]
MPTISTSRFPNTLAAAFVALAASAGAAAAQSEPMGVWIDNTGRGAVEIAPCGNVLCGRVVWVKSEKDREGCGEQIIGNVRSAGDGTWSGGWIYSPDHGRKFDVELKPIGDEKLRVVGWAGIRLFSETHYWKRAPADLARCDRKETAGGVTATAMAAGSPSAAAPVGNVAAGGTLPAAKSNAPESAGATGNAGVAVASAGETNTADEGPSRGGDGLQLDKFLKKSKDGSCKLDTPWIEIKFNCKDL